jgi:tetratricopeptide (TPR) repeat protein
LASSLLRRVEDAPMLRDIITTGAEGNPFYMEELLRMLIDEGAILADRMPWRVVPDRLLSTKVPTTLTGVLQARLDSLLERDRRLVQQASVVGVVFWDQALHALRVDVPTRERLLAVAPETSKALESTQQRGLIHERQPSGFAGAHEFGFKHQILQQVTYDTVLKRQRQSYHARAAAWLAGLTGERAPERLGAAAEHYARAGDNANACRSFVQAAEWAASRGANTAMLAYVQRALGLAPIDDHAMRWRLLSVRERFLVTHDDHASHAADLDSMQQLAEAMDDDARRADVIWRRAFALEDNGDFAAATLLAQRSLELALAAGATAIATRAYAGLGYDLMRLGRYQEAQQAVDCGIALARASGDRMLEPHFLTDAGGIARAMGDPVKALTHFQEALQITREIGNPGNEAMMLNNLADGEMRLGDYTAARDHLQASLEVARSTGNRTSESLALHNLAAAANQQGLHAEALAMAQASLEIEVAVGLRHSEGISLLQLGHARLALDQHEAAQADYERARSLFEAVGGQAMTMEALAGLARAAMAQGDIAQARTFVQQILQYEDGGGRFDGTEEPLRIALTCWEVMRASNDPRAMSLLEDAHAGLQSQAAQIAESRLRESFVHAVPHHRAIEEAWAEESASRSTHRMPS